MKSVLSGFIGAAIICAICGCDSNSTPTASTGVDTGKRSPEQFASNDQPIKGHDGRYVKKKEVIAVAGLVHVDVIDSSAKAIGSADGKVREVDVKADDPQQIKLTNVFIGGILYDKAKRQIGSNWIIILRDANLGHGIMVSGQTPTGAGPNIIVSTQNKADYFDVHTVIAGSGVTVYSLNDTSCGGKTCGEFASIFVHAPPSSDVEYTCDDPDPGKSKCGIGIGMVKSATGPKR